MAYNFSVSKSGSVDLPTLHDRLLKADLIEFFPVEVSDNLVEFGISIPFTKMDHVRFASQLEELITELVVMSGFHVFDLYSGAEVLSQEIPGLAMKISV